MRTKADSPTKTCTTPDCGRPLRAKGLCSTHYNQQIPERHKKVSLACAGCGVPVVKDAGRDRRYTNVYCSMQCRTEHQWRATRAAKKTVALYKPRPLWMKAVSNVTRPTRSSRTFVGGYCRVCGASFLCPFGSLTCSAECQREAHRAVRREAGHRRRALERNAYRAPVFRATIYERDGWICQLCMLPIERDQVAPLPLAPSIDHVIPLARGGTHEPSNVQAAHFICNARKGDRTYVRVSELAC